MSDISASEGTEAVSEAPVADAPVAEVEAFDLDSAVEDFATNAPDEWKGKAGKIQNELKNLRSKYTPYRDTFDGMHEGDKEAVFQLVSAIKSGNTEAAATWMVEAAKGLTGDQFEEKFGFTKAEAAEAIADASDEGEIEPELTVAEQIQKALDDREKAHKDQLATAERQTAINTTFSELGYNTERKADGTLADFRTQMVAQLAVNDHKGDIAAAHEAFGKLQADWATAYLKAHSDDQSLSPGQGTATTSPEPQTENMSPKDRVKARLLRAANGPEA